MINLKIKDKPTLKELQDLAEMMVIFKELTNHGVIFWSKKDKILIIEEHIVMLKMSEEKESFLKFLTQIAIWQHDALIKEAYEILCLSAENEAIRDAQRNIKRNTQNKYPLLSKADIQRIRQNVRDKMPFLALGQLDCIKEFDIFMVKANAPLTQNVTKDNSKLIALGHFDGEKVEIVDNYKK